MTNQELHENLTREERVKIPSVRSFAIVFAVFFVVVALLPILAGGTPRLWAAVVAGAFLVLGYFAPAVLMPLNLLWFRFGLLLHKLVSPVILALVFLIAVVPVALILRLLGKSLIPTKFDPSVSSYWVLRDPPGPPQNSMTRQF